MEDTIAMVHTKQLQIYSNLLKSNNSVLNVISLNNNECNLRAMIDTGSPISFVKGEVYQNYLKSIKSLDDSYSIYNSLSDTPINIYGRVWVQVELREFPIRALNCYLHVIMMNSFQEDLIIGRDMLHYENLAFLYYPRENVNITNASSFPFTLCNDIFREPDNLENIIRETSIDFDDQVKEELVKLIVKILRQKEPLINNGYWIKVKLIDESAYTYFSYVLSTTIRCKIREVMENLLENKIIKSSKSPSCLHIISVDEKHDSLGLYVNFQNYNSRVIKLFPFVEDCFKQLIHKIVFTLLKLKHGFHKINMDSYNIKYFSFSTPDGLQFTSTRLAFDFSEAPMEFHTYLSHILKQLIQDNKVIVYIDDILIYSDSIDTNLATLREVLILLKTYGFNLNLEKCQFLRRNIKFLGYITVGDDNNNNFNYYHVNAVKYFTRSTSSQDVQSFLANFYMNRNEIELDNYYGAEYKTPFLFNVGDYVRVQYLKIMPINNKNLKSIYKGPYMVTKVFNKIRYVVQHIPGLELDDIEIPLYSSILFPTDIKHWIKKIDETSQIGKLTNIYSEQR